MLFVWCLTAPSEFYSFSLHDALPICRWIFSAGSLELQQYYLSQSLLAATGEPLVGDWLLPASGYSLSLRYLFSRSEEHTSELQSRGHLVCRLLFEKKKYSNKTRRVET